MRTDEQKNTNKKPQQKSTNQRTQRTLICVHLQNEKNERKKEKDAHCPHRHYHHRQQNCRQAQHQLKKNQGLLANWSQHQSVNHSLSLSSSPLSLWSVSSIRTQSWELVDILWKILHTWNLGGGAKGYPTSVQLAEGWIPEEEGVSNKQTPRGATPLLLLSRT